MSNQSRIPRRAFLKGLGTVMALPLLEAMTPATRLFGSAGDAAALAPKRMAFVYIPNGANMVDWTPQKVGTDFDLPYILEPLEKYKRDFQVLSGLAQDKARANGDGAGDHARASATFLTGCQAKKTHGVDIRIGVSVDQIAAEVAGQATRLPSLELGCDRTRQSGNCDSGYSCAYSYNIAWKTESMPLPSESNPRVVFERLFASDNAAENQESRARRNQYKKSVLDFAMDDAKQLQRGLGQTDRFKVDEYLTAVREMERRVERAERFEASMPDYAQPTGVPEEHEDHIRLMYDMMALAFQTDTTRISTFLISHEGSNRTYPFIGVPEGHHYLSHHGNDEEKKQKIAKINRFHSEQFAYFMEKMKSIQEGEGSLLDNCMIVYGSGISDGNRHNNEDLPVILAGGGGGTLRPGRHVKYKHEIPMTNLYLSMLDRMNVPAERIGDSTGRMESI
ncbi:MAG: DUF1552 domain-containing protein [Opitutales bacterium]